MLANELDYVVGVDTHRNEHVIAVVTAPAGAVAAEAAATAIGRGYRRLLGVVEQNAPGRRAWRPARLRLPRLEGRLHRPESLLLVHHRAQHNGHRDIHTVALRLHGASRVTVRAHWRARGQERVRFGAWEPMSRFEART